MSQTRSIIGITLDNKLISWINDNRGLVSRSRFVEKMILDGIQTKKLRLNELNEFPSSKQFIISGETQWKR